MAFCSGAVPRGRIRQQLIEENLLDAVVGLPANLFTTTGIPVAILIFDRSREEGGANADRRDVLFIDASKEFTPGKTQNVMDDAHVAKVLETYGARAEVEAVFASGQPRGDRRERLQPEYPPLCRHLRAGGRDRTSPPCRRTSSGSRPSWRRCVRRWLGISRSSVLMLEGWRHATVEEICQRVSVGIVIKPSQYYVENGEGIRAFRSANIGENKVVDRDWVYLSNAGHEANKKSAPPRRRRSGRAVRRPWHSMCSCQRISQAATASMSCLRVRIAVKFCQSIWLATRIRTSASSMSSAIRADSPLQHFNVGAYKEMLVLLPPAPRTAQDRPRSCGLGTRRSKSSPPSALRSSSGTAGSRWLSSLAVGS